MEYKRKVYLDTVDLNEAKEIINNVILKRCKLLKLRMIPVVDSLHQVTTEPVFSQLSSPFYNASAMDGIAVIAKKTHDADFNHQVELFKGVDYMDVNTGDPIIAPYDSVIMIEDVIDRNENSVFINKSCSQFQHIRPIGEDIVAQEMIIPAHHKIRPVDISAMMAGGVEMISVYDAPLVTIIPTGDEIISHSKEMAIGKIIDSNSHFLKNSVVELGGKATTTIPVKDHKDRIKEAILEAVKKSQLVLVVAGSSSGSKDYTATIIEELGEVFVHGVSIKPGKPVIIGMVEQVPVIGVPGYPVSTFVAFDQLIKPLVNGMYHQETQAYPVVEAKLTKKLYSSLNHLEFVRVKLGVVNDQLIATPLSRGAGVTMSLVNADGLLLIDKESEGYEANELVEVQLLKNLNEIQQSIVSIGSHDIVLDYISNLFIQEGLNTRLSSAHVGSFSGVMAMKRGECHIAPIHILDPITGTYNIETLKKYFKDDVVLLKGIKREQGMMVRKDNPKKIKNVKDLVQEDVTFINRQKGSGTRILFDYLLVQQNIDSNQINGYEFEVTTHMMIASSVYSKAVDCGLGVRSAAQIFDLDFIPVGFEDYDFLVLKSALETKPIQDLIKVLKGEAFKQVITKLGGYQIDNIGEVIEL